MSTKNSDVVEWAKFFRDAGIPPGLGANYSILFCDHRIQKSLLGDLTREILVEMGIKAMGDIICILKQADIVSQQVTRENTSKLIANPASSSPKPTSAASRMITHTISSRDLSSKSSTPECSLKTAETPANKSVFARLGQDNATETSASGVFGRLGDPVSNKSGTELPYAGVLKKKAGDSNTTIDLTSAKKTTLQKTKMVSIKMTTPSTGSNKRKSVMDRLGPADKITSPPKIQRISLSPTVSTKQNVVAKKKTIIQIKKKTIQSSSDEEDTEEEVVKPIKAQKIIRTISTAKPKKIILKKKIQPVTAMDQPSKTNILTRLGGHVTSSTNQSKPKLISLKSKTQQAILKKTINNKPTKTISTKSGVVHLKRPLSTSKKMSKPISSNLVSSTTSAGIFSRRKTSSSSSVFDRLGGGA